jgi:hypothetical protein
VWEGGDVRIPLFRHRRVGPRYSVWSTLFSIVLAIMLVLAVCIWALEQAP